MNLIYLLISLVLGIILGLFLFVRYDKKNIESLSKAEDDFFCHCGSMDSDGFLRGNQYSCRQCHATHIKIKPQIPTQQSVKAYVSINSKVTGI